MSEHDDLNAQIAVHLFGWRFAAAERLWVDQAGHWLDWDSPAYTTDPAATALVWQWLETYVLPFSIGFVYHAAGDVQCVLCTRPPQSCEVDGSGATWPEALCRAALALALALDKGEGEA